MQKRECRPQSAIEWSSIWGKYNLFLSVLWVAVSFVSTAASAQTYEIDAEDGNTITTCSGVFSDSRYTGDYYDNENYTVTFCSGSDDFLRFIFNPGQSDGAFDDGNFELVAGDVLYVYDGIGTGGTLITTITDADDPGADHFILYSQSPCITFNFISDAAGDDNGWRADISCVPSGCGTNPAAADDFANAPYICNLDGFCGTTAGYTEDNPANMTGAGGSCPTLFGGTIENNSWLQFEASATSITLDITVPTCYDAFGATTNLTNLGIQMGIFEYDGTNFTRVSDCTQTDGNASGSSGSLTLTSTSLVVGNTYYIMVDGYQGSECDYYIETTAGVATLSAGDDVTICDGSSTTLTATGPSGSSYSWEAIGGGFGPTAGSTVSVSPSTTTSYEVTSTSGLCTSLTDTVIVTVNTCASCSIDGITAGTQTACNPADDTYTQEIIVTYSHPPTTGDLVVNGQNFSITSSPQTVTLTALVADGNAVDVTASFSDETACTDTVSALFTAPALCSSTPCNPDNGSWD